MLSHLTSRARGLAAKVAAGSLATLGLFAAPQAASAATYDYLLYLGIDISTSIDATEYALQTQGYINAFSDAEVQARILSQPNGVAIAMSQWATTDSVFELPFFTITDAASYGNFQTALAAALVRNNGSPCDIEGCSTGVANAINTANSRIATFRGAGNTASTQIIDISGDGEDNAGGNVPLARDAALTAGIQINGLPIGGATITQYYIDNVVTGAPLPGFVTPANDFGDFDSAVKTKIKREFSQVPGPLPLFGVAAAFGFSRRLRQRVKFSS
jgi:hypothetical protein